MADEQNPAPEAGDELMADEAIFKMQREAKEAPEAKDEAPQPAPDDAPKGEGQEKDQPAEGETPEEEMSRSKARRERRKAEMERVKQENEEAQRALRAAEEELARLRQSAGSQKPPKPEDFQSYDEYLVQLSAFNTNQVMDDRERAQVERRQQEARAQVEQSQRRQQQEIAQAWQSQVEDAKTRYADFQEVVGAEDLPIPPHVAQIIAGSESGADIAYHLGTHREEAAQIAQMPPMQAAMAIGQISARLSLPQPNRVTKSPDPVQPVTPKASAQKDPSKMTVKEWREHRKKLGLT